MNTYAVVKSAGISSVALNAATYTPLHTEWDKLEMKQGQRGHFTAMTR